MYRMSSFRSAAPLRAGIPMSAAPPSPANATTVTSSFPNRFKALLIPEAQIADVSKRTWRLGTLNAFGGDMSLKIRRQEAGMDTTVWGPGPLHPAPPDPRPAAARARGVAGGEEVFLGEILDRRHGLTPRVPIQCTPEAPRPFPAASPVFLNITSTSSGFTSRPPRPAKNPTTGMSDS